MLTIGIDDAARGPVIGPMFLAGVLVDDNSRAALKKFGIKESKQVLQPRRVEMAKFIREAVLGFHVVKSTPEEIDNFVLKGANLNTLEAIKTAEIINELNTKKDKIKVIIDCPSVNPKAWMRTLRDFIENGGNLELACEHKADVNHVEAAAASILAKVAREEEVVILKKKYGDIGSGYPADPTTKEFLKKKGRELAQSGIFRKSWAPWRKIFPDKEQATLEGF